MNNPRPVMSVRKTVQLMVILTLLAWATQTLFAQWGRGGLIMPQRAPQSPSSFGSAPAAAPSAPVVTGAPAPAPAPAPAMIDRFNGGAMIELQPRAQFAGKGNITLRDVCRWSKHDAPIMEPYAGTLIAKVGSGPRVQQVTIDDVKSRLHDAGANLSVLQFTGSAQCAILVDGATENDAPVVVLPGDPSPAIAPNAVSTEAVAAEPAPEAAAPAAPAATEPATPIVEEQLVLTRPLSRGQRIIASDIVVQRVEVDQPATRPATSVTRDQVIGNVAARDLKKGDVIEPASIARPAVVTKGQFLTVALRVGQFDVETVARALDSAAIGETVRAKNEANGDVYRVTVTAANEGHVQDSNNAGVREDVAAVSPN